MDLKEIGILGDQADTHWYYRAKAAAMLRLLRGVPQGEVLDVGAGSGFFARAVLDGTDAPGATCVDPNYPDDRDEMHGGKPIRFVRRAAQFEGRLVLMMDVLEHVADDRALLAEYAALAPAGTHFLITVPALPWLWSGHDVFLGHFRRYTLRQVDRLVTQVGLHHLASSYYFGLVLPLAAASRLGRRLGPRQAGRPGSDLSRQSAPVDALLLALCRAELPLFAFNRLAGLSVFALART